MQDLILVRGLPGSGKTTFARAIAKANIAADDYFDKFNDGEFNPQELKDAHNWCKNEVRDMMKRHIPTIAVHNTFTREWEMQDYFDLAEEYHYRVHTIVVENRHDHKSVHDVPEKTMKKMEDRFEIVI